MLFTCTLGFPHEYVVLTGSKVMVTLKYLMAFKKLGYNEGKQLHNHKNNSKIYYNNYEFLYFTHIHQM